MGDVTPIKDRWKQTSMIDDGGKPVSVVKFEFALETPVEEGIYNYLTNK